MVYHRNTKMREATVLQCLNSKKQVLWDMPMKILIKSSYKELFREKFLARCARLPPCGGKDAARAQGVDTTATLQKSEASTLQKNATRSTTRNKYPAKQAKPSQRSLVPPGRPPRVSKSML
jgi:hypothetical protein